MTQVSILVLFRIDIFLIGKLRITNWYISGVKHSDGPCWHVTMYLRPGERGPAHGRLSGKSPPSHVPTGARGRRPPGEEHGLIHHLGRESSEAGNQGQESGRPSPSFLTRTQWDSAVKWWSKVGEQEPSSGFLPHRACVRSSPLHPLPSNAGRPRTPAALLFDGTDAAACKAMLQCCIAHLIVSLLGLCPQQSGA